MTAKKVVLNIVLPVVAVVGAVMVLNHLMATRAPAPQRPSMPNQQFVVVEAARLHQDAVHVKGVGRVKAAREVTLAPEVSGRVVAMAPQLQQGGVLHEGEVAFEIDDRAYRLVVKQQSANLAKARVDLRVEGGRKAVAEKEALLEDKIEATAEGKSLALREPYKRLAEVQVAAAAAALERARLDVARTKITVPFNAFVREESVEVGLLASPQVPLAKLVGTDAFWVEVTVPLDEVQRIAILGLGGVAPGQGAQAVITQVGTATQTASEGRVIRLLEELDPLGAQARLLVEIPDPLGLKTARAEGPLFLGAFVDVEIEAAGFDQVVAVPRKALRNGKEVWVLGPEDTLEIRPVTIAWRERDDVLVNAGLQPGERIITSRLTAPVPGMALQVAEPPKAKTATGAAPAPDAPAKGTP